jgi:hypothetical protein
MVFESTIRSNVGGADAEGERRLAQRGSLVVGLVRDGGGLVVADVLATAVRPG